MEKDFHYQNTQEWLFAEFKRRRVKNPALSLRAFSKFLKVSPSRLSELLNGKRILTFRQATQITDRLQLLPPAKAAVMSLVQKEHECTKRKLNDYKKLQQYLSDQQSPEYRVLSGDTYHVIADWYYFGILSLVETKSFKGTESEISQRLGLSQTETKIAVERLLRLQLLVRKNGKLVRGKDLHIATTEDVPSSAIAKGHTQLLEKAISALNDVDVLKRDFSSMTMAIDPGKLPEAKKMIKQFRRNLCRFLEKDARSEVFALAIQLYPLSDLEEK